MRQRISPTTIIACLALFLSLGGVGIAAQRYLITSASQIQPSVRHALQGKRGPRGAQGVQGVHGVQGAAGQTGPQGVAGPAVNLDGDYASTSGAALCSPAQSSPGFSCAPTADVTVRCNPGDHVLSGGFQGTGEIVTTSQLVGMSVVNGVTTGRGWEVVAHLDPAASSGSVSAHILCVG